MEKHENILAEDFGTGKILLDGYGDFFDGLMKVTAEKEINSDLGPAIESYVMDYIGNREVRSENYDDRSYVRNYVGRDEQSGWEAIVMSWKKGNRTAIHSHPQFASYTIVDGEFLVEIFEPAAEPGKARLVQSLVADTPKCFYAIAERKGFENHLHRITCLSETGNTLHIYSDDALKGYKYTEI